MNAMEHFERELDTLFAEWAELPEWEAVRRFAKLFHQAAFYHGFDELWGKMTARKFPGRR